MSKAKLQKFAEYDAFTNTFDAQSQMKGKWAAHFGNGNPIVLELACGKADYTVGLARLFPEKNFIGVDIKGSRMWRGAKTCLEDGLKNAAFLRIPIDHIEGHFEVGEVDEIWITFADPQAGKARKRLTHPLFLNRYRRVMKPGGTVHLKTDSELLFDFTLETLEAEKITPDEVIRDVYANGDPGPVLSIRTWYENMWLKEGRTIQYLRFRLV
ncbi:MAG: tRNA (guanosine(46)-N7)-methyltransferase TrmB [Bacteroidota bacterium]